MFNFYTDDLAIDTYNGLETSKLIRHTMYDNLEEPWLPDILEKNPDKYALLPTLEAVDGHLCHVLEYPKYDKIWVDTNRGFTVSRRETHWGEGYPLRRRITNLQHTLVESRGLWLPMMQIYEQFCSMRDPKEDWNQVSHKRTVKVHKLELAQVKDSMLAIDVPDGSVVIDRIRNIRYTKLPPTADPIKRSVVEAKASPQARSVSRSTFSMFFLINALLLASLVFVGLLRRTLRARSLRAAQPG